MTLHKHGLQQRVKSNPKSEELLNTWTSQFKKHKISQNSRYQFFFFKDCPKWNPQCHHHHHHHQLLHFQRFCPNPVISPHISWSFWTNISEPTKISSPKLPISSHHSANAALILTPISSPSGQASPNAPFHGSLVPSLPKPPFTISISNYTTSTSALFHKVCLYMFGFILNYRCSNYCCICNMFMF